MRRILVSGGSCRLWRYVIFVTWARLLISFMIAMKCLITGSLFIIFSTSPDFRPGNTGLLLLLYSAHFTYLWRDGCSSECVLELLFYVYVSVIAASKMVFEWNLWENFSTFYSKLKSEMWNLGLYGTLMSTESFLIYRALFESWVLLAYYLMVWIQITSVAILICDTCPPCNKSWIYFLCIFMFVTWFFIWKQT